MTDRTGLISVLHEDPDLAEPLALADAEAARRRAMARAISLPKAEFSAHDTFPGEPGTLGMLVVEGLLLRAVSVTGRPMVEVLGRGDVIRPFERDFERELDRDAIVSAEVRWWALRPARLAVLDASFTRRMSEYPEVIAELAGRLARRSAGASLRLAVIQEPCLSARLHFMLWHLADRFGRVHPEGVVMDVPLCHGLLGWLVGARRPAVSRALKELERAGHLARRTDGTWFLGRQPQDGVAGLMQDAQRLAA